MTDVAPQHRPWASLAAAGIGAAIAIGILWSIRTYGGYCVDGIEGVESSCANYSSASGAAPGSIAVLVLFVALVVATLIVDPQGPGRRRIVMAAFVALLVLTVVIGVIANVSIIEYPEGYPR